MNKNRVVIKRVKRNKKKIRPSQKILSGIGIGSSLLGGAAGFNKLQSQVQPTSPTQIVGRQNQGGKKEGKSAGEKIKDLIASIFHVNKAKAESYDWIDSGYFSDISMPDTTTDVVNPAETNDTLSGILNNSGTVPDSPGNDTVTDDTQLTFDQTQNVLDSTNIQPDTTETEFTTQNNNPDVITSETAVTEQLAADKQAEDAAAAQAAETAAALAVATPEEFSAAFSSNNAGTSTWSGDNTVYNGAGVAIGTRDSDGNFHSLDVFTQLQNTTAAAEAAAEAATAQQQTVPAQSQQTEQTNVIAFGFGNVPLHYNDNGYFVDANNVLYDYDAVGNLVPQIINTKDLIDLPTNTNLDEFNRNLNDQTLTAGILPAEPAATDNTPTEYLDTSGNPISLIVDPIANQVQSPGPNYFDSTPAPVVTEGTTRVDNTGGRSVNQTFMTMGSAPAAWTDTPKNGDIFVSADGANYKYQDGNFITVATKPFVAPEPIAVSQNLPDLPDAPVVNLPTEIPAPDLAMKDIIGINPTALPAPLNFSPSYSEKGIAVESLSTEGLPILGTEGVAPEAQAMVNPNQLTEVKDLSVQTPATSLTDGTNKLPNNIQKIIDSSKPVAQPSVLTSALTGPTAADLTDAARQTSINVLTALGVTVTEGGHGSYILEQDGKTVYVQPEDLLGEARARLDAAPLSKPGALSAAQTAGLNLSAKVAAAETKLAVAETKALQAAKDKVSGAFGFIKSKLTKTPDGVYNGQATASADPDAPAVVISDKQGNETNLYKLGDGTYVDFDGNIYLKREKGQYQDSGANITQFDPSAIYSAQKTIVGPNKQTLTAVGNGTFKDSDGNVYDTESNPLGIKVKTSGEITAIGVDFQQNIDDAVAKNLIALQKQKTGLQVSVQTDGIHVSGKDWEADIILSKQDFATQIFSFDQSLLQKGLNLAGNALAVGLAGPAGLGLKSGVTSVVIGKNTVVIDFTQPVVTTKDRFTVVMDKDSVDFLNKDGTTAYEYTQAELKSVMQPGANVDFLSEWLGKGNFFVNAATGSKNGTAVIVNQWMNTPTPAASAAGGN